VPAGTLDVPGEDALSAAHVNCTKIGATTQWTLLGRFMTSPGWSNQLMTIYERGTHTTSRHPRARRGRLDRAMVSRENCARLFGVSQRSNTTVALGRVYGTFFDDV